MNRIQRHVSADREATRSPWITNWRSWWRWLRQEDGEGGGISLMVLIMVPALVIAFGLVIDGGTKATALDRANRVAMEAARAGAQAVSGSAGNWSATAARQAAQDYLAAEDLTGSVTFSGDRVQVEVSWAEPTKVLSIIGVDDLAVQGEGFADVFYRVGE